MMKLLETKLLFSMVISWFSWSWMEEKASKALIIIKGKGTQKSFKLYTNVLFHLAFWKRPPDVTVVNDSHVWGILRFFLSHMRLLTCWPQPQYNNNGEAGHLYHPHPHHHHLHHHHKSQGAWSSKGWSSLQNNVIPISKLHGEKEYRATQA